MDFTRLRTIHQYYSCNDSGLTDILMSLLMPTVSHNRLFEGALVRRKHPMFYNENNMCEHRQFSRLHDYETSLLPYAGCSSISILPIFLFCLFILCPIYCFEVSSVISEKTNLVPKGSLRSIPMFSPNAQNALDVDHFVHLLNNSESPLVGYFPRSVFAANKHKIMCLSTILFIMGGVLKFLLERVWVYIRYSSLSHFPIEFKILNISNVRFILMVFCSYGVCGCLLGLMHYWLLTYFGLDRSPASLCILITSLGYLILFRFLVPMFWCCWFHFFEEAVMCLLSSFIFTTAFIPMEASATPSRMVLLAVVICLLGSFINSVLINKLLKVNILKSYANRIAKEIMFETNHITRREDIRRQFRYLWRLEKYCNTNKTQGNDDPSGLINSADHVSHKDKERILLLLLCRDILIENYEENT